ncbi:MAG: ATP-binding protein [Bacteroidales bacterium]|nr:ATP-binding protein [Bacteroidales bacterium]
MEISQRVPFLKKASILTHSMLFRFHQDVSCSVTKNENTIIKRVLKALVGRLRDRNVTEEKLALQNHEIVRQKEELEKLFHPEQIFSTVGTANEKGTGLGLILCKEFVEKNGGKIFAESKPGMGPVFSFTLPFDENKS